MKKQKTIKEFFFKELERNDVANLVNKDLPINIKSLEPLINRIYERYPIIDKTQISIIVKTTFETLRELLVLGHILNLNKLAFDMKLHFFPHRLEKIYAALKIKLTTPPKIRKI